MNSITDREVNTTINSISNIAKRDKIVSQKDESSTF